MIQIRLNRCMGEGCEDDETIFSYFRKTLVGILSNRVRFDREKFGEEAVIREAEFLWNPLSTQIQQEIVYKLSRTELQLQDRHINLDDLTEVTDNSVFRLKKETPRPFEW